MFEQSRLSIWALPTLAAGLIWVLQAASLSLFAGLLLWIPAVAMLASGGAQVFAPGDRRITQIGALAGLVGVLVALPFVFVIGPLPALGLAAAGIVATVGSGRMALQLEPHTPGVPVPRPGLGLAARVAADELILGFEQAKGSIGFPLDGTIDRVVDEIEQMHAFFARKGLLEKPEAYHIRPPDLDDPELRREVIAGRRVEVLRFESGYAPADGEPGRDRWLGYDACRDGWAYVLRHQGEPRPWLVATNGYRMGHARIDVGLFARFHEKLGVNVLVPVLPLHGQRRLGFQSGSGFLGVDVVDTIHAETQAIWDMRRLLSWIQEQDAPAVGAFGLSLGGLTTANFASLAEGLVAVVTGIPLVDIRRMIERHASPPQVRYATSIGYDLDRVGEILRVISPLSLEPRVPWTGRMIFGGNADRLVTPDHVRDLWRHWDEPEIVWYEGAHLSFIGEPEVWSGVDRALRDAGISA